MAPPSSQGHAGKWVKQGKVGSLVTLGLVVDSGCFLICLRSGHVLSSSIHTQAVNPLSPLVPVLEKARVPHVLSGNPRPLGGSDNHQSDPQGTISLRSSWAIGVPGVGAGGLGPYPPALLQASFPQSFQDIVEGHQGSHSGPCPGSEVSVGHK